MIQVRNVSKEFAKRISKKQEEMFLADSDINFVANEGEILGILGPNGAGKTTLLRMIAGIMRPTSGRIIINNMNYDDNEIQLKKRIAFLSGCTKLYPGMSVYELLEMCCNYYDIQNEKERIEEVVNEFEISSFLYHKISKLSTGQGQRVGLARCALHDPKVYILDEATSGLDIILRQIVLDFVKKERDKGKCILYSTHYMEEAESICDRVIIMHEGKIIAQGTPKEIKEETNTDNIRDSFFELTKSKRDA